jgi:hypothetical protein
MDPSPQPAENSRSDLSPPCGERLSKSYAILINHHFQIEALMDLQLKNKIALITGHFFALARPCTIWDIGPLPTAWGEVF